METGTVLDSLLSMDGCDSIVQTVTTYNPGYFITVLQSSCDSWEVGTDTIYSITSDGCDSILVIETELAPKLEINVTEEICFNDSIEVGGFYFDSSGSYIIGQQTINGCDSITLLDVEVLPASNPSCITGLNSSSLVNFVELYPNPFHNNTTLIYNVISLAALNVDIYNVNGVRNKRLLSEWKLPGEYELVVSAEDLQPGIYLIVIWTDIEVQSMKLMLLR